jgi:hypothetical protein
MRTRRSLVLAALPILLLARSVDGAAAQAVQSHYTSTGPKACKTHAKSKPSDEMPWVELSCRGRGGYVVRVSDIDLRMTVSIGRTIAAAEKEPAAEKHFGPFNHAHDTVEWRSLAGKPFAMIQRWSLSDTQNLAPSGRPAEVAMLVVTRLPPGPVCHVAYIDAKANPDHNALARQTADEKAAAFRCGTDKTAIVGNAGRATELAAPR